MKMIIVVILFLIPVPAVWAESNSVESLLLEDPGVAVHSIGIVLDGTDQEHFRKHLETLIDTATRFEFLVSQVAAIGLMLPGKSTFHMNDFIFSPHAFSLMALEGQLAPYPALPNGLGSIKRSPTWVINTVEGTVLVEGYEKIWKLFNSKGEFLGFEDLPSIFSKLNQKEQLLAERAAKEAITDVSMELFDRQPEVEREEAAHIKAMPKNIFTKKKPPMLQKEKSPMFHQSPHNVVTKEIDGVGSREKDELVPLF
ncbi:MAG: hypothetical protein KDD55_04910 [Bdellovibrionales bacterium]|nr:hypothetical protein [Bdellovibrionales bacterium]